jgi:hypothetical protein
MASGVILDNQFGSNLRVYAGLMGTTLSKEINKQAANVCYKAAEYTPFIERSALKAQLENLPVTKDGNKKRSGDKSRLGLYKLANWQNKNLGLPPWNSKKSKNSVQKFISSRTSRTKYIRIGWSWCAKQFGKPFTRGNFSDKTMNRIAGAQVALPTDLEAVFMNKAGSRDVRYKAKPMRVESGAIAVERRHSPLSKAIQVVQAHIASEMAFRLQEQADKYNVKRITRTIEL